MAAAQRSCSLHKWAAGYGMCLSKQAAAMHPPSSLTPPQRCVVVACKGSASWVKVGLGLISSAAIRATSLDGRLQPVPPSLLVCPFRSIECRCSQQWHTQCATNLMFTHTCRQQSHAQVPAQKSSPTSNSHSHVRHGAGAGAGTNESNEPRPPCAAHKLQLQFVFAANVQSSSQCAQAGRRTATLRPA